MAKPANKALAQKHKFAAMYVNGPESARGNWDECNRLIGTKFEPGDEDIARMIEDEGGTAPGKLAEPAPEPVAAGPETIDWRDELSHTPQTQDEWCQMAERLKDTAEDIANGTVKASAAQAQMLKHAFDRCYGRVQERASDKKPASGVLLLPMLGSGAVATICPRCGFELGESSESGHMES